MPKPKPEIEPVAMNVRVRPEIREALNALAVRQGRSLNALCSEALEQLLAPRPQLRIAGQLGAVGAGVEVLTIVQNGPDRWDGAMVLSEGTNAGRYLVRFIGGPRKGQELWLAEEDRQRSWRWA